MLHLQIACIWIARAEQSFAGLLRTPLLYVPPLEVGPHPDLQAGMKV